jgi:hypothetical protein
MWTARPALSRCGTRWTRAARYPGLGKRDPTVLSLPLFRRAGHQIDEAAHHQPGVIGAPGDAQRGGLVDDTPAGTRRVYRVDPDALALLRSYFDAFWNRSLEGFRRAAEMTTPPPAGRSGTGQDPDDPQPDPLGGEQ